jgi:hypothetical protein
LLTVSGAKYNSRRSFDDNKGNLSRNGNDSPALSLVGGNTGNVTTSNNFRNEQLASDMFAKGLYSSNSAHDVAPKSNTANTTNTTNHSSGGFSNTANNSNNNNNQPTGAASALSDVKFWKYANATDTNDTKEDMVVIHVCDENQQISKDFSCRRNILVEHMRYFQKFLNETENGYDDIDISVHCDVEIFEWLMNYIHDTENPPKMDKSILISILISSEFLQMDPLVDLCVAQVSQSLNEIIKLPIDLSCISEKLVNRIAAISSPKVLSDIRDRKDKILTKLYKRRVELDFSRKGSASKSIGGISAPRTIAASLTCCRYCGWVYLENYSAFLTCRKSPLSIDHRGRLASRHSAIQGWSLTSYLKTLHSGGMGWDAIYWHVWAACIVLRVEDVVISALETDRYGVEPDGLLIKCMVNGNKTTSTVLEGDGAGSGSAWASYKSSVRSSSSPVAGQASGCTKLVEFSLDMDMDAILSGSVQHTTATGSTAVISMGDGGSSSASSASGAQLIPSLKLYISSSSPNTLASTLTIPGITPTLNPLRPPEVLTSDIYDLICSQMKFITGLQHKTLITNTMQNMVTMTSKQEGTVASPATTQANPNSNASNALTNNSNGSSSIFQELQALDDEDNRLYYGGSGTSASGPGGNSGNGNETGGFLTNEEKRRGRSPARGYARLFSVSQEPRHNSSSNTSNGKAGRRSSTVGPALPSQASSSGAGAPGGVAGMSGNSSDNDPTDTPYDSDADAPGNQASGNNANAATNAGGSGNSNGGVAGTGKAKGTTRYHSHHHHQQGGPQPRARSLSSTGKRSTASSNVSSLMSGSGKMTANSAGLPPKGRMKPLLATDADGNTSAGGTSMGNTRMDEEYEEDLIPRLHRILTSMPPDLFHRAQHYQRGALFGVWLQPCALTWQPPALEEMLYVVEDSHLPEHKKLEWQLDLMREYDEKRMDKLERWLASKRNPALDLKTAIVVGGSNPKTSASKTRFGGNGQFYYKERMRLPYRCVI